MRQEQLPSYRRIRASNSSLREPSGYNGSVETVHSSKATRDFATLLWLTRATIEDEIHEVDWVEAA